MDELIKRLKLEKELEQRLLELIKSNEEKITSLAEKCKENGFSCLKKENELMRLAACVKYAEYTKKEYERLGISEKIFFDTMSDIAIWCENNDNKGLKNYNWIKNHTNAELFKIGRLQFQLYPCKNKTLNYSKMPFKYGENLIYIHIPQGEKLIYADCVASIKAANDFFAHYFPDYEYRFYFSESWLLFEENYLFMKSSSNILQFQSLFEIVDSLAIDVQAIERIFGKRRLFKRNYPENTSLQKSAKAFMLDGGRMGIGIGVIDKNEL